MRFPVHLKLLLLKQSSLRPTVEETLPSLKSCPETKQRWICMSIRARGDGFAALHFENSRIKTVIWRRGKSLRSEERHQRREVEADNIRLQFDSIGVLSAMS
jgi:hypothetical protein